MTKPSTTISTLFASLESSLNRFAAHNERAGKAGEITHKAELAAKVASVQLEADLTIAAVMKARAGSPDLDAAVAERERLEKMFN